MIHQYIADLAGYALQTGLMEEADFPWAVNSLCQALDQARALKGGEVERLLELVRESGRSSAM